MNKLHRLVVGEIADNFPITIYWCFRNFWMTLSATILSLNTI